MNDQKDKWIKRAKTTAIGAGAFGIGIAPLWLLVHIFGVKSLLVLYFVLVGGAASYLAGKVIQPRLAKFFKQQKEG